jgi:hypothetical protein
MFGVRKCDAGTRDRTGKSGRKMITGCGVELCLRDRGLQWVLGILGEWNDCLVDWGKRRDREEMEEMAEYEQSVFGMGWDKSGNEWRIEWDMSQEQFNSTADCSYNNLSSKGSPTPNFLSDQATSLTSNVLLLSSKYTNGLHFYPNIWTLVAKRGALWDVRLVVLSTVPSRSPRSDGSPKCSYLLYISKDVKNGSAWVSNLDSNWISWL